jgi:hypothetical protein
MNEARGGRLRRALRFEEVCSVYPTKFAQERWSRRDSRPRDAPPQTRCAPEKSSGAAFAAADPSAAVAARDERASRT